MRLLAPLLVRVVADGVPAEIPLYPESRDCRSPTARRVFEVFAPIQHHELRDAEALRQSFPPELNELQRLLLGLLVVPETLYLPTASAVG